MSTLRSYLHGVNTISGAYTVFGLCFFVILQFDSNHNTFGMDLGIWFIFFFLCICTWGEEIRKGIGGQRRAIVGSFEMWNSGSMGKFTLG